MRYNSDRNFIINLVICNKRAYIDYLRQSYRKKERNARRLK